MDFKPTVEISEEDTLPIVDDASELDIEPGTEDD